MPDIKWIKITTEMFDDEKIRIIERMPEADTIIVIWVRLICLAGKVNAGGHIFLTPDLPYDDEQLAAVFNRELNTVRLAMETFKRLQMIEMTEEGHILLPAFEKHQNIEGMKTIKEQTRKRVANHRERQKVKQIASESENNVTVTLRNATDKNRIEYNREDKNDIWDNVLNNIKTTINALNFKTYLGNTQFIEITDDEIIIAVKDEETAAFIESNQRGLIEKEVMTETGKRLSLKMVLVE